jgi:hypothetical protein
MCPRRHRASVWPTTGVTQHEGHEQLRGPSNGRRIYAALRVPHGMRLESFGLHDVFPLSRQNYFESLETFGLDTNLASNQADGSSSQKKYCPPVEAADRPMADSMVEHALYCPPDAEAGAEPEADSADSTDGSGRDKENKDAMCSALGMTAEQAIDIWTREGRPVIHVGPGENCFDLERLLSQRDINGRHLEAVTGWLARKEQVHATERMGLGGTKGKDTVQGGIAPFTVVPCFPC